MKNKLRFYAVSVLLIFLIVIVATIGLLRWKNYWHEARESYYEPVEHAYRFDRGNEIINALIGKFYTHPQLPAYRIWVREKHLRKLFGDLPHSGFQDVDADILLPDKIRKVQGTVRLRGDSHWHWNYPKKSWRINIADKRMGDQKINLVNSRFRSHVLFALEYFLAEQAGILSPKHRFAVLFVNDEYQGVYDEIEHVDGNFLTRRNLKDGALFDGEPDADILFGFVEKKLDPLLGVFVDVDMWTYKGPYDAPSEDDRIRLRQLMDLSIKPEVDAATFEAIEKIADVDKFLRFIALLNILNSDHVSNGANFKIYFNPLTRRFEPIAWDIISHFQTGLVEKNGTIVTNALLRQILREPTWFARKNRYVWDMIHDFASAEAINDVIDTSADIIAYDLFFDPAKDYVDFTYMYPKPPHVGYNFYWPHRMLSFSSWRAGVEYVKKWIDVRISYWRRSLSAPQYNAYLSVTQDYSVVTVDVRGEVPLAWEIPDGEVVVYRDIDFDGRLSQTDTPLDRDVREVMYPGVFVSQRYSYIVAPLKKNEPMIGDVKSLLKFRNAITGDDVAPLFESINALEKIPSHLPNDSLHIWRAL